MTVTVLHSVPVRREGIGIVDTVGCVVAGLVSASLHANDRI